MAMDAANVITAGMDLHVKCLQDTAIYYAMAVLAQLSQTVMNVQQMHMKVTMVNVFVSYTGQVLTVRST